MSGRRYIKNGLVFDPDWERTRSIEGVHGGTLVAREAGFVEWLLWKLFRKEPKP